MHFKATESSATAQICVWKTNRREAGMKPDSGKRKKIEKGEGAGGQLVDRAIKGGGNGRMAGSG